MAEELHFYTNQCLDECRRVGKDNGDALVDHFMENSQIQCDYIEQVSCLLLMWLALLGVR